MLIKAFVVGGLICVIGQLLIDKTKMMSGRILVLYVCIGCILGGLGIYQKLEVGSRDELMLYIELFRCCDRLQELTGELEEAK